MTKTKGMTSVKQFDAFAAQTIGKSPRNQLVKKRTQQARLKMAQSQSDRQRNHKPITLAETPWDKGVE